MAYLTLFMELVVLFLLTCLLCWLVNALWIFNPLFTLVLLLVGILGLGYGALVVVDNI